MALLLAYVGGPGAVVIKAEGTIVHPSWSHFTCCLPAMTVDGFFLRRCKQGTVQFVLLKPLMAALTLILYAAGDYTDGDMSPRNGYVCSQQIATHREHSRANTGLLFDSSSRLCS